LLVLNQKTGHILILDQSNFPLNWEILETQLHAFYATQTHLADETDPILDFMRSRPRNLPRATSPELASEVSEILTPVEVGSYISVRDVSYPTTTPAKQKKSKAVTTVMMMMMMAPEVLFTTASAIIITTLFS
jgi:hypothetical protein